MKGQIEMKTNTEKLLEPNNATTHIVKVRFFLKLKRRDNTCNGNGYGIWSLDWAWFRKRGSKRLWRQKIGNGDNGERCIG